MFSKNKRKLYIYFIIVLQNVTFIIQQQMDFACKTERMIYKKNLIAAEKDNNMYTTW